ncbi:MAG: ribonuclease HII [Alphaproteobacteria bacterium]|jgi:ribonuclease HII|nr:ribonuclease HII [Alphaproteobacteria bacterium]
MTRPNFELEDACDLPVIYGVDEVGRGPLAGPVVAACAYIPKVKRHHPVWSQVRDSKKLSAIRRDMLFSSITTQCIFGIGIASVEEIDQINILQATFLAMKRALSTCSPTPDKVLIDGNRSPKDWEWDHQTVIKGDSQSVSIAAASIIAKVTRDRIMTELDIEYPHYHWADNAGYGTAHHLSSLNNFGATPHHRKSFAPVRDLIQKQAG